MKILIVDDSKAMQHIVKRGLEKLGYDDLEIVLASNGMDALRLAKEWQPELILSDWHMPEMTGLELMHELSKAMLDVDIGFVTTESSAERIKEATDAGALFVVSKPFDVETLHNAVLPALQRRQVKSPQLDTDAEASPDESAELDIVMPKSESLQKALKLLTVKEILVSTKDIDDPQASWLPCIIGLFGFDNEKNIKVVIVFDILGAMILGANSESVLKSTIDAAIKEKVIPKDVVANCERALNMISLVIDREVDDRELTMISMSTLTTNIDKLGALVGRKGVKRIDYNVSNKDYSNGRIIILCP
ncbi:MAG: response regulator [Oleispira sp.]